MSAAEATYSCRPSEALPEIVTLQIRFDAARLVREEFVSGGARMAMGISQPWRKAALRDWPDIVKAFSELERWSRPVPL